MINKDVELVIRIEAGRLVNRLKRKTLSIIKIMEQKTPKREGKGIHFAIIIELNSRDSEFSKRASH